MNLKVAVLSTDMLEHTAVAGTFDKKVVIMDTREEVKKMTYYRSHSMPVLGLRVTDRHIFSLSEDRTLVIYDRAAGKRYGETLFVCFPRQGIEDNMLFPG